VRTSNPTFVILVDINGDGSAVGLHFVQWCQWIRSWIQGHTGLCKRIAWQVTRMLWFIDVCNIHVYARADAGWYDIKIWPIYFTLPLVA
jgi:hypothetical protein